MSDIPPEAHAALQLGAGEAILNSWRAIHRCGPATRGLPDMPDRMEGFLVLTSQSLKFIQETGGVFSKVYRGFAPLTWSLASLGEIAPPSKQSGLEKVLWFKVQGEFFSVGNGGAQENGRAQWTIERFRSTASRTGTSKAPPVPMAPTPVPRQSVAQAPLTSAPVRASLPPSNQPQIAVAPPPPASPPAPTASPPVVVNTLPTPTNSESKGRTAQGMSHPGMPIWPMVPMTVVETSDANSFWSIVGSSGVDRSKLLVVCTESPGEISASYGLAGAVLWRFSRVEGEGKVSPGDADRLENILEEHLERESGQAIALKGLDRVIEEAGFRTARRLLEMVREIAEKTRGAVIVHIDSIVIGPKELHQLEDDVKVLRI